jgi:hypothetical protein
MRVKIQRVTFYLLKEKGTQANEVIDLQGISNEYWHSARHEFIVLSQLRCPMSSLMTNKWAEDVVIGKNHVSLELRFSADATVRYFTSKHLSQLTMSA